MERSALRQGAVSWCLAAIGACSYSIYVWHFVFIELQRANGWVPLWVGNHELNAALVITLTTLPVVLAFSALSYHAAEKPFLALRTRYLGADEKANVPSAEAVPAR
jgi:peptidoglycan/LPS O-acetylase OafA/YrhL